MASIKHKTHVILILFFFNTTLYGQVEENSNEAIRTVVIDAGHGGRDPGCVGKYLKEKDVALFLTLKLGEFIKQKYPSVHVIYTRDSDYFVELDQRAKIANENNADLFISIHANAASAAAYGTETFVLGLHRSESQQKVAERENSTIHFEENSEEKYADFDMSPDALIARQIQLSVFLDQSIEFASNIQQQFKSVGRKDRGVKQAGFIVLYKTTMPSVLIEAGFLTNAKEEAYMRDTLNQIKLANSIFKAFQEYKASIEGIESMVIDGKGVAEAIELQKDNQTDKNEVKKLPPHEKDALIFKVQIETSKTKLERSNQVFKGLNVEEYKQDGLFKYTTGEFVNDLENAKKYREQLKNQGFKHAFVVAFQNGVRIPMTDAMKMIQE